MGSGFRVWTAGEVVSASNVNNYLQEQAVMSFAGTAARSSAIASPEEGMLSYLQDSDTYQGYDGAAWVNLGTLSGASDSGLVHIVTTTGTGVSSISLPQGTFTSTYNNYRIIIDVSDSTTDNSFTARLRASGTDNTSSVYNNAVFYVTSGASTGVAANSTTATSWDIGYMANAASGGLIVLEVFNPFASTVTFASVHQNRLDVAAGSTGNGEMRIGTLSHSSTTSFDSLSVIRASGNMTGSIYVYGYRK